MGARKRMTWRYEKIVGRAEKVREAGQVAAGRGGWREGGGSGRPFSARSCAFCIRNTAEVYGALSTVTRIDLLNSQGRTRRWEL